MCVCVCVYSVYVVDDVDGTVQQDDDDDDIDIISDGGP